ncbi:hypothetical protein J1605_018872 [Eschrichtius robustus]|uniref:Kazal-like domain-containing protein n=1 Tax=Eschrichtius robustus TaxID=9764 RepID=A0AB34HSI8_ESCRO|nr:hypothetical protein J1605_018872 [Eschrichtius robustus]
MDPFGSSSEARKDLRVWGQFLISDRDPQCNLHCSRTQPKPICASDGRSYESMCEYQRAKCRDPALGVVHRGRCKDAGQSKCRLERAQALEQAKKPQEAVFVPECSEDGSFTQRLLPCDRQPLASFCFAEARLDQVVFAGEGNFQISPGRIAK